MSKPKILDITAEGLREHDLFAEGEVVCIVTRRFTEMLVDVVTVAPVLIEYAHLPDGTPAHELDWSTKQQYTFRPDDPLRVVRPAPEVRCQTCGVS